MSIFSAIGNVAGLFSKDPTFRTLRNTKDTAIQGQLNTAIGDNKNLYNQGQEALSDFITRYLSTAKQRQGYTGQEVAALDRPYTGQTAADLAGLRAGREAAVNNAADVAVQQAMRGVRSAAMGTGGTGGSYTDRLAIGATLPARTAAAVDAANQAQADYATVQNLQRDLAGRRSQLLASDAQSALVPWQAGQNLATSNLGNLNNLTAVSNANNIFGVQRRTTPLDRFINFMQQNQTGLNNDIGMATSVMGLGGGLGGGGSTPVGYMGQNLDNTVGTNSGSRSSL